MNHFWLRNENDREIVLSVFYHDEYRLGRMAALGWPARTIVDIGAHIGSFTRLAKHYWPQAQMIAIDPSEDAAAFFAMNTRGCDAVYHHRCAIVPPGCPKSATLVASEDGNLAARYIAEVIHDLRPDIATGRGDVVPATTLSEILRDHQNPEIDILKLDCEGAEPTILEELQATGYLRKVQWICGEWHHDESVARIAAALLPTHDLELHRHPSPIGSFFARRK